MFCDCILLPRLTSLFPTYNEYEAKLRSKGLQVQKISPSYTKGFVYVRLEDSGNHFNHELISSLNELIKELKTEFKALKKAHEDDKYLKVDDIYVYQVDYT